MANATIRDYRGVVPDNGKVTAALMPGTIVKRGTTEAAENDFAVAGAADATLKTYILVENDTIGQDFDAAYTANTGCYVVELREGVVFDAVVDAGTWAKDARVKLADNGKWVLANSTGDVVAAYVTNRAVTTSTGNRITLTATNRIKI